MLESGIRRELAVRKLMRSLTRTTLSVDILLLSSPDATTVAVKKPASRDVTGSSLERHWRRSERALFVETEAQNVTVAPGDRAVLNCRVQQLGDKTVR